MKVLTVLGDVEATDLGAVFIHEHLILDNAHIEENFPHIHLPSVDDAVAELEPCVEAGAGTMVDAMPAAGGRHPARLADISRRTGMHILATTGLHTPKYYVHHPFATGASVEQLAALFIGDVEEGIDRYDYTGPVVERTDHRAGVIKVATTEVGVDDRARRVFEAATVASTTTGAPILTHTEDGAKAAEQVEEFHRLGFPLRRVVISHTDKTMDFGYHRSLLESGVYLEYDQALRQDPADPKGTAWLVARAAEEGFLDQITLGTDGARRTLWSTFGGAPGLAWMRTGFLDKLRGHGLTDQQIASVWTTNPQRFLSLEVLAA